MAVADKKYEKIKGDTKTLLFEFLKFWKEQNKPDMEKGVFERFLKLQTFRKEGIITKKGRKNTMGTEFSDIANEMIDSCVPPELQFMIVKKKDNMAYYNFVWSGLYCEKVERLFRNLIENFFAKLFLKKEGNNLERKR